MVQDGGEVWIILLYRTGRFCLILDQVLCACLCTIVLIGCNLQVKCSCSVVIRSDLLVPVMNRTPWFCTLCKLSICVLEIVLSGTVGYISVDCTRAR